MFLFVLYFTYFALRMTDPEKSTLPNVEDSKTPGIAITMIVLNTLIAINSIIKCGSFLRVDESFALMVLLIVEVMADMKNFFAFLMVWVFLFSALFLIAGGNVYSEDDYEEEYKDVNRFISTFIQVFRNSIGDLKVPNYEFWIDKENKFPPAFQNTMVGYMWVLWFLSSIFMLVMLLNFLIAIISQTYDKVMSQSIIIKYRMRCELNCEASLFKLYLNKIKGIHHNAMVFGLSAVIDEDS